MTDQPDHEQCNCLGCREQRMSPEHRERRRKLGQDLNQLCTAATDLSTLDCQDILITMLMACVAFEPSRDEAVALLEDILERIDTYFDQFVAPKFAAETERDGQPIH